MNAFATIDAPISIDPSHDPCDRSHIDAVIVGLEAISPELAAQWDGLAADSSEPNAFIERWFVEASIPLCRTNEVRLIAAYCDTMLIGLLPIIRARSYGRLPLAHVQNWLHYHSFLGGPLLRRGHEQAAWTAILAALDADRSLTGLLHLTGLVEDGTTHTALAAAARATGRPCDTVHRIERAMLASELSPEIYYATTVRKKKRKELNRLQSRLAELGAVTTRRLSTSDDLDAWIDTFLALEQSGWKGRAGSGLACQPETANFFRNALWGARRAGRLEMLRLEVAGQTIAVLVNFLAPPGSFSFKTAFDEAYARYSPGVLIQLENLHILSHNDISWMDSCAAESHPMINSLWGERRTIVRVTLPLRGWRSHAQFHAARTIERIAKVMRASRQPSAMETEE